MSQMFLRRYAIGLVVLGIAAAGCHGGGGKHKATPTPGGSTPTSTVTIGVTATATSNASPTPTATPETGCQVGPIDTTVGDVCGNTTTIASTTVRQFLGIPYAESTGGENRWEPPVPKARATGMIQATAFGPICPQDNPPANVPAASEDCLSINVWSPNGAGPDAKLPVMVFIYGGSFLTGSSAVPAYDGAYLTATQNVVVVTLNYRLGALGFLSSINGLEGNYGLQDQQLALHWVADNIAAFGGDPQQLMLFGESAGAMSVGLHLLSIPSSENLFAAALMESNPLALPYKGPAEAEKIGRCFRKLLGCEGGGVECMRGKSADEIVATQGDPALQLEGLSRGFSGFLLFAPLLDGTFITAQPVTASALGLMKPTLLGTNLNEGTLFVESALQELGIATLSGPAYETLMLLLLGPDNAAKALQVYPAMAGDNAPTLSQVANDYLFFCSTRHVAQAGGSPVFAYLFTQVSNFNIWPSVPRCADEVCHGDEIPYVFHTATNIGASFTPDEEALSQTMTNYWAGYGRPGFDPNTGGTSRPTWPEFSGNNYLILDSPISTEVDPPHHCDLWDMIGYTALSEGAMLDLPDDILCQAP